jgi:mRNA-degrading endonuclease RelE of RelBE toxin-antitoxin system
VAAALQIWSPTFSKAFDALPSAVRELVQRKVDGMGARLANFPHKRLEGVRSSNYESAIIACFMNSI